MVVGTLLAGLVLTSERGESIENWPTWRGPNADGVSQKGNPPITLSESKNIKWKVKLSAGGDGSPVIWGDKIFIQTAVALEDKAQLEVAE
jgi:hypothetical protein